MSFHNGKSASILVQVLSPPLLSRPLSFDVLCSGSDAGGGLVLPKTLSTVPSGAMYDEWERSAPLTSVCAVLFLSMCFPFSLYTSIVSSFETSGFYVTGFPLDDIVFGFVMINRSSPITPQRTKPLPCLQSYPKCLDEIIWCMAMCRRVFLPCNYPKTSPSSHPLSPPSLTRLPVALPETINVPPSSDSFQPGGT